MITTPRATPADPFDAVSLRSRTQPAPTGWPLAVLLVGLGFTVLLIGLQWFDVGGLGHTWEVAHWNVAAISAAVAALLATRGTTGLVRRVRLASALGLAVWALANLVWVALFLLDMATAPSIADLIAVGFLVPGAWALVSSVRGRVSRAEEIAVYLDDALMFMAVAAILAATAGDAAVAATGAGGLLVTLYPSLFLGAGVVGLVSLVAARTPLRDTAGAATGIGALLIGFAYTGWVLPAAMGQPTESPFGVLFSIGALVAGFGAISWLDRAGGSGGSRPRGRAVSWGVAPAALVVSMLCSSAFAPSDALVNAVLDGLVALSVAMLFIRFGLHLVERGRTVDALEAARAENEVLIGRLQLELEERERTQQRLIDASRMTAVGELAAAIAHEVNNPLTSVLGYADLLVTGMDADDPRRADLLVIRSESIRVRDRLRSLLEFAAPRRTVLVGADLATIVAAPLELLRYHLERRGIAIDLRHDPMPEVRTDPSSIQQAVINLVTELASAMPAGGRIGVATRPIGDRATVIIEPDRIDIDLDGVASWLLPDLSGDGTEDQDRLHASLGMLRGHGATIATRQGVGGRSQIEISLPFAAPMRA